MFPGINLLLLHTAGLRRKLVKIGGLSEPPWLRACISKRMERFSYKGGRGVPGRVHIGAFKIRVGPGLGYTLR